MAGFLVLQIPLMYPNSLEMKKLLHCFCILFLAIPVVAAQSGGDDKKITTEAYIQQWGATAVRNMKQYGIPASITLAQGILESGSGNSYLAKKGNNHFGIKCHSDWKGKTMYHDDDAKGECFRVYLSAAASFEDHSLFLKNKRRYAFLFDYKPDDYKAWAKGLKKAGYATNPKYPKLLIGIIERYQLDAYDKGKVKLTAPEEEPKEVAPVVENEAPALDEETGTTVITLSRSMVEGTNGINTTVAKAGDSPQKVADAFDMALWQIKKYNDVGTFYDFEDGEKIYLQPKRRRNCDIKNYTVGDSVDLRAISQEVGVKQKHILRLNRMEDAKEIKPGATLSVCKKVKREGGFSLF